MRELLCVPEINPPEQVLHHAILYRDRISTLVPVGHRLSHRTALAQDAGVFHPRSIRDVWHDPSVREESIEGMRRSLKTAARRNGHVITFGASDGTKPSGAHDSEVNLVAIDFASWPTAWSEVVAEVVDEISGGWWRAGQPRPVAPVAVDSWQTAILVGTAVALAGRLRRDVAAPLLLPAYPNEVSQVVRDCTAVGLGGHLLTRMDVGRFLPEPPPGVDTAAVIAFRQRHDDERRRLIRAVERLVKEAARTHGMEEPADVERDVREELDQALADLEQAGRCRFGGWVRRTAWFTVAAGAGAAVAGPTGAAMASVAANWASNPVPRGVRESDFTYLYRVQNALDDLTTT
ncbi:hypothetical protein C8D88_102266 [Lentzea atacamensis]|uniref:Uncharacterized protein n=1 Tax=Lentzea atacamensis TaxID=531938 RepID=A0A316IFC3_9PSEU|nr:hypothetical protein [Lentzea atacamensis]PWK88998.1 hypothetical protein C8D88_102266 [Lentzea atacamensis]